MSAAIKGYVVRGKRGSDGAAISAWTSDGGIGEPISAAVFRAPGVAAATADALIYRGCADVAIFRLLDDGREERLPSYEEALGEIERLRAIEALNIGAIDASLTRLGAVTGAIGPMPRHDARCLIHDGAGCSFEAGCDAGRALMSPADPLAALEAAERRLLEAGGWIEVEAERWQWPGAASPECRTVALTIERRRLAAKGGA